MFAEHSIAETAQRLTYLADSSVNFFYPRRHPQIFEMFYVDKWCVVNGDGWGGGWEYGAGWCSISVFLRLIVRPKILDASEKRSSIRCRPCSAWATSVQSSANRTSWRRVRRLLIFTVSRRRSKTELFKR